jgi:thiol:disulfide interchange protein DsbD
VVHNVETTAFEFPTTQSLQQGLWVQYNTKGEPQSAHWAYPAGQAPSAGENASNWSIWTLLVLAFAGGLLLNAMPCVFPVLSLKAMSLLTERRPTNTSWFHTTAYSLGTMTTMVGLGLLVVVLQQTGQAVGWGFQLQSPGFVLNLMVLFTLLAVAFWGRIDIPGLQIHGRLGQRMHQPSPWGDFFTGALIVGVATPCTAPFMGVAMGVALTQSPWVIVLTFASLGLGLAFPFLLLHLFPRLTHFLPKPGMWMDRASKILALPLALSVIWLAWVLQNLTHPWMSWLALGTCVTMACCFFWRHFRSFSRIVLLAAAFWGLAWGLMHALELGTTNATTVVHDDRWQPYSAQAITDGLANNQPVFVDFTADWCLTCKVNERLTFTQDRVWQTVKEKNILMLKADWTRRDPAITQALKKLDRIGVPVYALWLPGQTKPILLPSVLTAGVFLEAIEKNL